MKIDEKLFATDSPYLKAADHTDMNKIVTIESVGEDEYEGDNGNVEKFIYIAVKGGSKPIKVAKGQLKKLVAALGDDSGAWIGRKINLSTQEWNINGNNTVGWNMTVIGDEPDDDIPF